MAGGFVFLISRFVTAGVQCTPLQGAFPSDGCRGEQCSPAGASHTPRSSFVKARGQAVMLSGRNSLR